MQHNISEGNPVSVTDVLGTHVPRQHNFHTRVPYHVGTGVPHKIAAQAHVCGSASERRIHVVRSRGSYYLRRPMAAPYREDRWHTARELLLDLAGVVFVIALLTAIFWLPALTR